IQQVGQDLNQAFLVAGDERQVGGDLGTELMLLLVRQWFDHGDRPFDYRPKCKGSCLNLAWAGLIFYKCKRALRIRVSRSLCCRMMSRNRTLVAGSSLPPSSNASTYPLIDVRGVRSSCDTLATKSFRIFSSLRSSVISWNTSTAQASLSCSPPATEAST